MHKTVGYQPGDTASRDVMSTLLDRRWISVRDVSPSDLQFVDHLRHDFIEEMTSVRRLLGMPPLEQFPQTTDPSQEHDRACNTQMATTAPPTPHTYATGPSGFAPVPSRYASGLSGYTTGPSGYAVGPSTSHHTSYMPQPVDYD
ncbi:hypothetical protein DH2020_020217 [Rehmannia glutinosa]|uniref:Uncharacterized protein n=1 Tax=Rehmannia glutinosa TaxID=99300 RepID=A0ABR0WFG7_REHGL